MISCGDEGVSGSFGVSGLFGGGIMSISSGVHCEIEQARIE